MLPHMGVETATAEHTKEQPYGVQVQPSTRFDNGAGTVAIEQSGPDAHSVPRVAPTFVSGCASVPASCGLPPEASSATGTHSFSTGIVPGPHT